jgi:hypothetical protein
MPSDAPSTDHPPHTGQCLCGAVRYCVHGPLRGVVACHCSQCRRTSGHFAAMTSVAAADLELAAHATLVWYRSSPTAERGFCQVCGSNLFWRQFASDAISIGAGTLDVPTGISLEKHIFVADKSDYYELDDPLPHLTGW